ncbi:MAG: sigma 54-interacting transcriptional regulator [Polyangiaceae bacterium]
MSGGEITATLSIARSSDGRALYRPSPGLVLLFCEGRRVDLAPSSGPAPHVVEGQLRVGREPSTDLCLPDQHVSRLHAIVEPSSGGLLVRDQGSHNGTGALLPQPGAHTLRYVSIRTELVVPFDSVLRMGNTLLYVTDDVQAFQQPGHGLTLLGGPWLRRLVSPLSGALAASETALLEGETGTGKERMAHELHVLSQRQGPFVAVNCAALPGELIESELFGHVRGAFSGSKDGRQGLFRSADGGTLLLDEIGDLPLAAQSKLLRVLEEHAVRPVGQDRAEPVDVRVLAATNRDLLRMCSEGLFREDLFHRLATLRLRLPPLRERRYDIPALACHFLDGLQPDAAIRLTAGAIEGLIARAWPGNARELRNTVRASGLGARAAGRSEVRAEDLLDIDAPASRPSWNIPSEPSVVPPQSGVHVKPSRGDVESLQRERLVTALEMCGGNVAEAARRLNMRRARLYELFNRFGINPETFRQDK